MRLAREFSIVACVLSLSCLSLIAAEHVQVVELKAGWNAVWLVVEPADPDPDVVFAGLPVDLVGTYFPAVGQTRFVEDPDGLDWNTPSWAVWYPPEREEHVFSNLPALHGNRAYLIRAMSDCQWQAKGRRIKSEVRWTANAFNFVGFPLDVVSPPAFETFFSSSKAHADSRFYRLNEGKWRLVTNPANTAMHAAEAYAVYCRGRSDYQGPVQLEADFAESVAFGDHSEVTLTFRNCSDTPQTVTLVRPPANRLPLCHKEKTVVDGRPKASYPVLPDQWVLPEMQPGETVTPTLVLRRNDVPDGGSEEILKAVTPTGMVFFIPLIVD